MEIDITKKITEYIEGSKDFLLDNAPEFLKEIVFYGRIKELFQFAIFCGIIFIIFYWLYLLNKYTDKEKEAFIPSYHGEEYTIDVSEALAMGILLFCLIPSFYFLYQSIISSIMLFAAPKLYILRMVRGN